MQTKTITVEVTYTGLPIKLLDRQIVLNMTLGGLEWYGKIVDGVEDAVEIKTRHVFRKTVDAVSYAVDRPKGEPQEPESEGDPLDLYRQRSPAPDLDRALGKERDRDG